MNLYSIHQPDPGSVDLGAECWALVWADNEADALAHYVDYYKGKCDPRATDAEFAAQCVCTLKEGHGQTPDEQGTHFERRRQVEREMGCYCEGEDACESCWLYAMDMDEYWVCPECLTCVECGGHQDDCTEKDA